MIDNMSKIPTKRLINLYTKATAHPGVLIKDCEWELCINKERDHIVMYHYCTMIYQNKNGVVSIGGAYSNTDRDYINGLIGLMGLSGHAYIDKFVLHYTDDNGVQIADCDRFGEW